MASWVPTACTLPTEQQPLRVAEFDGLFTDALRRVERPASTWLRLHLEAGDSTRARTRELVDRETRCCSFFAFDLAAAQHGLVLDVRVPDERTSVLDALEQRTSTARPAAP